MARRQSPKATQRARDLRKRQTDAESLLWYVLRGRRRCGLKFRRQYPIEPWIVDFACSERLLIVELDGAYHEATLEADARRESDLCRKGWDVIRFTNDDVLSDVEAVAVAIARHLGLTPALAGPPHPNPLPQTNHGRAKNDGQLQACMGWGRGG